MVNWRCPFGSRDITTDEPSEPGRGGSHGENGIISQAANEVFAFPDGTTVLKRILAARADGFKILGIFRDALRIAFYKSLEVTQRSRTHIECKREQNTSNFRIECQEDTENRTKMRPLFGNNDETMQIHIGLPIYTY